jgi:hypothetical protein
MLSFKLQHVSWLICAQAAQKASNSPLVGYYLFSGSIYVIISTNYFYTDAIITHTFLNTCYRLLTMTHQ